ncbi:MAG: hypothetical protein K8F53_07445 [Rhodocyclaceae bacterium]|jgi:hypothetical protein|nr:hypothetical protein [Rhodocyclaceae bacterium]
MRILLFLGFIVLSVLVPVGLAQAQVSTRPYLRQVEPQVCSGLADETLTRAIVMNSIWLGEHIDNQG